MIYRFGGGCALDSERRELRRDGVLCAVEPQVFDLLEYLLRNRDRVVSRDDIFNSVWRGRMVSDAALSTRINAARRAIGDSGERQRLIRTLRGRGLRFVGAVREHGGERPAPGRAGELAAARREAALGLSGTPAVAVLPLTNRTTDLRLEGCSIALTDEVITALYRSDWIGVASRHSSFAYKGKTIETRQVTRALGVRYLLTGSVYQAGDRVQIMMQLVDGAIDQHVWAGRYDRSAAEVFAGPRVIAEEIAVAVARALYAAETARAGASPATLNTWQAIARALALMNSREKPHVAEAGAVLRRAIALDGKSARAHSLLSVAVSLGVHMGWARRSSAIPLALEIAQRAASLNPEEPWAQLALGYATIYRHPDDAIPRLEKALTLNRNLAVAHYLIALASSYAGHCDDVPHHAEMADKLSAVDLLAHGNSGMHHNVRATAAYITGDYGEGIDFARQALAQSPALVSAHRALVINCALMGKTEEARSALERLKRLVPHMSQHWLEETTAMWLRAQDRQKYRDAFRIAGLAA